jgi:hypothetical protein
MEANKQTICYNFNHIKIRYPPFETKTKRERTVVGNASSFFSVFVLKINDSCALFLLELFLDWGLVISDVTELIDGKLQNGSLIESRIE